MGRKHVGCSLSTKRNPRTPHVQQLIGAFGFDRMEWIFPGSIIRVSPFFTWKTSRFTLYSASPSEKYANSAWSLWIWYWKDQWGLWKLWESFAITGVQPSSKSFPFSFGCCGNLYKYIDSSSPYFETQDTNFKKQDTW